MPWHGSTAICTQQGKQLPSDAWTTAFVAFEVVVEPKSILEVPRNTCMASFQYFLDVLCDPVLRASAGSSGHAPEHVEAHAWSDFVSSRYTTFFSSYSFDSPLNCNISWLCFIFPAFKMLVWTIPGTDKRSIQILPCVCVKLLTISVPVCRMCVV